MRKRSSPVGVRLGLSFPALIQRRIVGMEIPRWRQARTVPIQGSDSERGAVLVLFDFIFSCTHLFACKRYRQLSHDAACHPILHAGCADVQKTRFTMRWRSKKHAYTMRCRQVCDHARCVFLTEAGGPLGEEGKEQTSFFRDYFGFFPLKALFSRSRHSLTLPSVSERKQVKHLGTLSFFSASASESLIFAILNSWTSGGSTLNTRTREALRSSRTSGAFLT